MFKVSLQAPCWGAHQPTPCVKPELSHPLCETLCSLCLCAEKNSIDCDNLKCTHYCFIDAGLITPTKLYIYQHGLYHQFELMQIRPFIQLLTIRIYRLYTLFPMLYQHNHRVIFYIQSCRNFFQFTIFQFTFFVSLNQLVGF